MLRWNLVLPLFAGLAALAVLSGACGGGGGNGSSVDASTPQGGLQRAIDAWNREDVDEFLVAVSDAFLIDVLGYTSREDARLNVGEILGDPELSLSDLAEPVITGGQATLSGLIYFGQMGGPELFTMAREGDRWLLDNDTPAPGAVPEGTTAVEITLSEYQFDFDEAAVSGGDFGFAVSNAGVEEHEIGILNVPDGLNVDLLLPDEPFPEGVEQVGFVGPFHPATTSAVLFKEPLDSGRYVLLCFLPAPDGEDHASKGMLTEFTVE